MKKAIKTLGNILTIILFALCIWVIVKSTIANKQNRPAFFFKYAISVVVTPSMDDSHKENPIEKDPIRVDYLIIYKEVDISEINVGDIIVFRSEADGKTITHRVVEKKYELGEMVYITQGDANEYPIDGVDRVTAGNFYGKVVSWGSFLGIGKVVKDGRGFLFIVVIIGFLLLALMEVKNIYLHLKSYKEEEMKNKMKEELMKELMAEGAVENINPESKEIEEVDEEKTEKEKTEN